MVVSCPKCKTKLRIPEEKIKSGGSTFKCPKCSTLLRVKKPEKRKRELDENKVMIAHEKADVVEKAMRVLAEAGYMVYTAYDGVDMMVQAMKELPFMSILDIAIPKINGFEIARRLKARTETRDMKIILVSSPGDERRQRKLPPALYGVDGYVDEDKITEELSEFIKPQADKQEERPAPPETPSTPEGVSSPAVTAPEKETDERVERAKRLARTVLSDIELYSPEKVIEAVRNNNFQAVFSDELREGLKFYEKRIPEDVRNMGNFFQDAVDKYIENKRKSLGLPD